MKVEKILINGEEIEFASLVSEEYLEINPMLENTLDLSLELASINSETFGDRENE